MRRLIQFISLSIFSTLACAEGTAAAPSATSSAISQGLLLGGFIAIFYFMILRPQSKRAKQHRQLMSSLSKDDEIVTSGGMVGKITQVDEQFLSVKIAKDVEIQIQKQAVIQALPKGTLNIA